MSWVKITERLPPCKGWYNVVKFIAGTEQKGFFSPEPPRKEIKHYLWAEKLELEQTFPDRIVYRRFNCFVDEHGIKQKPEEIFYWYELDEIPED